MDSPKYALETDPRAPASAYGDGVLALCKDVDGLFAEPGPSHRARFELRGCAEPRGELARAVAEATVAGTAPLGELLVRTADEQLRLLEDVRVLARTGDVVTVEAVTWPHPEYADDGEDGPAAAETRCVNLVRVSPDEPEERTHTEVTFLGCSPRGPLRDALETGTEDLPAAVMFQRLAYMGVVAHFEGRARLVDLKPSRRHYGLFDLTVLVDRCDLRVPGIGGIWDLWWWQRPEEPGTWARFPSGTRREWLVQAERRAWDLPGYGAGVATYHLDGRHVVDADSFHCALGEAVLGPGGYVADNLHGLAKNLVVGVGDTLVWHDADTARACLGVRPLARHQPPTFDRIVTTLEATGLTVVLA
ncbi:MULTISPECIES: hypothetical protein [Streptomyces]|uniref:Barstar (barnase inhibitor) domain-containing protein n=1 Tax=Streptomyces solicathayae TaxID=3081768 RepID=A0ABZ0LTB8_9ACTN|nr:hypothetical protein [Streptomyces sp. HUAS YS2]WOX22735.1 hypothetical protein R2D22_15540 [Streptomyces sp. HUAS YS2]